MKMPNLGGLLDKAGSSINAIPGVFWYKVALVVLLFTGYTTLIYTKGVHNAELKCEQQKTEQAEQKVKTVVHEVRVRVPVVQRVEVESAKQKAEIANLKVKLDEALKNRPENPSCDLSDAELDGVQGLANKTHIRR